MHYIVVYGKHYEWTRQNILCISAEYSALSHYVFLALTNGEEKPGLNWTAIKDYDSLCVSPPPLFQDSLFLLLLSLILTVTVMLKEWDFQALVFFFKVSLLWGKIFQGGTSMKTY